MVKKNRKYFPSVSQMIDRLCIVTLKSIKVSEFKDDYEAEAKEILHDLDLLLGKDQGRFIRCVIVNAVVNEIMWANESEARKGNDKQGKRLVLTHSLNSVRNQASNNISDIMKGRKDKKLDYMSPELTKEFGFDFDKVL